MYVRKQGMARLLGIGLLLGSASCGDGTDGKSDGQPGDPVIPARGALASLVQASDCTDLLTRIQDDAIAKLKLSVEYAKVQAKAGAGKNGSRAVEDEEGDDSPTTSPGSLGVPTSTSKPATGGAGSSAGLPMPSKAPTGGDDGVAEEAPTSSDAPPVQQDPSAPVDSDGSSNSARDTSGSPTGASETNKQVADVDEADFVKVVESGKGIFLLHGNTLRKLQSWPAEQTKLVGSPLTIEGQPSEMFVTDEGKAVIFSSVGYGSGSRGDPGPAVDCWEGQCKGYGGGGLKITVADVTGAEPKVERELYYEGSYVSSRSYDGQAGDVVRAIVQANTKFSGLFEPDIEWYDPWGRLYDDANIASQLAEWEQRTTAAIRKTTLAEWIPEASEKKAGALVKIEPACGSYFVPEAGLSDYGLTHVLSLDVAHPEQPVGGVTILGASSTVYSSAQQLILAQPDYRWNESLDFGIESAQQTALHVFDLALANTTYRASSFIPGHLPQRNPQFGIDVKDGIIRLATTGQVRDKPDAARTEPAFWGQHTENYVLTARVTGNKLELVGKSDKLGHEGESVYSARFVGDRAYVVTFRQTDPFIVVDVADPAAPKNLGEALIPGFSEYMHPLDANHVITVGQSASRGIQLQLFDVTNPTQIPPPQTLDFGSGSSSEVSYQHKGFTLFEGVIALPVSGINYNSKYSSYVSALRLVRVDAVSGFSELGIVDHAGLYADNGVGVRCGVCDAMGCSSYSCGYTPEVRRGVFVKGDTGTYVYSFSHAGVLVNNLANLTQTVAKVGLPAPQYGYGGNDSVVGRPPMPTPTRGGGSVGIGGVTPTTDADDPPVPVAMPTTPVDAGMATTVAQTP